VSRKNEDSCGELSGYQEAGVRLEGLRKTCSSCKWDSNWRPEYKWDELELLLKLTSLRWIRTMTGT